MDSVSHTTGHNVSHMPSRNAGADPDTFQRIEIITGIGRRRRWSPEDKALMVAESFASEQSVLAVARRHGVNPNQLYAWRRRESFPGALRIKLWAMCFRVVKLAGAFSVRTRHSSSRKTMSMTQ